MIDLWLTDKLNAGFEAAQRRGLNLVKTHVYVAGGALVMTLAVQWMRSDFSIFWFASNALILGLYLQACIRWAEHNADYQTNWRRMKTLNAYVLMARDVRFWVIGLLVLGVFIIVSNASAVIFEGMSIVKALASVVAFVLVALSYWLNHVFFVAPNASAHREAPVEGVKGSA